MAILFKHFHRSRFVFENAGMYSNNTKLRKCIVCYQGNGLYYNAFIPVLFNAQLFFLKYLRRFLLWYWQK